MIKLSDYFKDRYGGKIVKLSLDGGFTCPNRLDGSGGCAFCSSLGSGDFAGIVSIRDDHAVLRHVGEPTDSGVRPAIEATRGLGSLGRQAESQKRLTEAKWKHQHPERYLAYFQSYTGTFADVNYLHALYREALELPGVIGFAVATRPDCLREEVIDLFAEPEFREKLFWIELGLQTAHNAILDEMNVGYHVEDFQQAMHRLRAKEIPVVVHLIVGFPGESEASFLDTVRLVAKEKPFGVKLHMLNIVKGSRLALRYTPEEWESKLLTMEEYIDRVVAALAILPPDTVIHRLTGDADHGSLIAPQWIKRKWEVLNAIDRRLGLRPDRS